MKRNEDRLIGDVGADTDGLDQGSIDQNGQRDPVLVVWREPRHRIPE
jgi:hypothetical protein